MLAPEINKVLCSVNQVSVLLYIYTVLKSEHKRNRVSPVV